MALTLVDIERAVRAAWSVETCDDHDVDDWSTANPARGQCTATAWTLHDLLGGEILSAEVLRSDGSRQGFHFWNRLGDGVEIDLTREQFSEDEIVQEPVVLPRTEVPVPGTEQYQRLRRAVLDALG